MGFATQSPPAKKERKKGKRSRPAKDETAQDDDDDDEWRDQKPNLQYEQSHMKETRHHTVSHNIQRQMGLTQRPTVIQLVVVKHERCQATRHRKQLPE